MFLMHQENLLARKPVFFKYAVAHAMKIRTMHCNAGKLIGIETKTEKNM